MTDTSLVGRVLEIFGRGLGIRLYLSLHLRKAINRRHGGNVKRFAHRWKHRSRQIRYVDNTASPSETSYLGQRLRLPKQRSSANHSALLQALSFIPAVLRPSPYSFVLVTTQVATLPKYVSHAFGSPDQPWKPGYLRSAYAAICCHRFKPPNQTDDIFLAQILGHKLLRPNASLSVGQSYKDFYFRKV